ncbi:MAG TPA: DUF262 domain-containing protein [Thermodesulfovibrionales bacterium]|nr:DUF262 domain-containing protein [Thermodesulfovibrionales bacterium]
MKKDVNWFLDLYQNGQLDLDPSYQRRSVWTLKDRKFFLDTIFKNYPCPAVFLHKEINEGAGKLIYHVVDGKQRLETIIRFAKNDIAMDKEYGDAKLSGKKWRVIENDPELKTRFTNYLLAVEYIDSVDGNYVNEVFDRLNRISRKLERQELRHAKYDGWFIATSETESEKDEWERFGIVTKARMKRMKDIQFISELLLVVLKNRIDGFDQDFIDNIYAEYDTPHETLPDFSEDDFRSKLAFAKDYLLHMENHNAAVTKYARGLGNFYSLWAFVVLNQPHLQHPNIVAERYADFMSKVETLAKERDLDKFLKEHEGAIYSKAYIYLRNLVQASIDQTQREAREKVLGSVLLS